MSASADDAVQRAAAALDAGELVIVPSDLGYLVAADALDDDAVERVFVATGRSADEPLVVLVAGYEDLHHVAYGGAVARELAQRHWPGPTGLALRPRPWLPDALLAGQEEVAVLVPAQPFAQALARRFGPIAAAGQAGAAGVALRVDAGALSAREAKVIRATGPAPG